MPPQTIHVALGNAGPVAVAPRSVPARPSLSLQLDSGGGDILPVFDDEAVNAEPQVQETPVPGPPIMPPADPGDGAPGDDGPGPGCGAASFAEGAWLVALTPAATALWERMDAAPWALCSLAVPAGLALVVGSCAADPSGWDEEIGAPRLLPRHEWQRGGSG
jgi:hypothetical protein